MKSTLMAFFGFAALALTGTTASAENPRAAVSNAPALIIVAVKHKNSVSPQIETGFSDSSFDYDRDRNDGLKPQNKSMCYVGNPHRVCEMIRGFERDKNENYRDGGHDNIKVHVCRMKRNKTIETIYWLTDDYGGNYRVIRLIKTCES